MGERREVSEAKRDEITEIVRRHRGRTVALFGSVARGEDTDGSDVDFLVDFDEGSSLFDCSTSRTSLQRCWGARSTWCRPLG